MQDRTKHLREEHLKLVDSRLPGHTLAFVEIFDQQLHFVDCESSACGHVASQGTSCQEGSFGGPESCQKPGESCDIVAVAVLQARHVLSNESVNRRDHANCH